VYIVRRQLLVVHFPHAAHAAKAGCSVDLSTVLHPYLAPL
jgi:hypothetical protein